MSGRYRSLQTHELLRLVESSMSTELEIELAARLDEAAERNDELAERLAYLEPDDTDDDEVPT